MSSTSDDAGATLWYRGSHLPTRNGALTLLAHAPPDYLAHWRSSLLRVRLVSAAGCGTSPPPSQDLFNGLVRGLR
jgi:hypothetical protein